MVSAYSDATISAVSPAARAPTTVATSILVPVRHGLPTRTSGSIVTPGKTSIVLLSRERPGSGGLLKTHHHLAGGATGHARRRNPEQSERPPPGSRVRVRLTVDALLIRQSPQVVIATQPGVNFRLLSTMGDGTESRGRSFLRITGTRFKLR